MKTVIIDNSLCTLPIAEGTSPELICRYIHALAETGVKYVELDFRTVMKMQELPDCVEYIFRLGDPMFAQLTQAFDFRYVVVTMHDIKDEIDVGNTPVILEIPRFEGFNRKLQALAQKFVSGPISMIRVRSSFDFMNIEQAKELVWRSKSACTVPIDVCPMDAKRTALDTALKVSNAGVDSMTLCMGKSKSYASLEDFLFTMTMVFNSMPKEYSIPALCKAEAYHRIIFGLKSADRITEQIEHILNCHSAGADFPCRYITAFAVNINGTASCGIGIHTLSDKRSDHAREHISRAAHSHARIARDVYKNRISVRNNGVCTFKNHDAGIFLGESFCRFYS